MAAPRKHPPSNALEDVERLALKGYSTIGLAKFFGVSRATVARWFKENERFEEAYEQGRDAYRQALEEQIVSMTLAGKIPAGLIYLLKAKFKMYDQPGSGKLVDVNVAVAPQPVLIVKDHGTDAAWQAKAIEQQKALTIDAAQNAPVPALPIDEPESLPAPVAPSYYGPPVMPWEAPVWKQNA
jgi:AcrR family transcriptional regulator